VGIHGSSSLALSRGWDVFARPQPVTGEALREVIWDRPAEDPFLSSIPSVIVRSAVQRSRANVIDVARHLRPLLGEIVAAQVVQPHVRLGLCSALAAAVRRGSHRGEPALDEKSHRILLVIEIAWLVTALHAELQPLGRHESQVTVWGRKTLSLVVADCLTAGALRTLYQLDACWTRRLSQLAQSVFRHQAEVSLQGREPTLEARPFFDMLLTAAAVGLSVQREVRLPAIMKYAARDLAAWHTGGAVTVSPADLLESLPVLLRGQRMGEGAPPMAVAVW
jgi:hypothetical protein